MNTDKFLRQIAESFHRTPEEIISFTIIIVTLIVVAVVAGIIKSIVHRNTLNSIVNKRFEKYVNKFSLTKQEIDVVNRMSRYLRKPVKKYLIFTNPHTFNTCFHLLKSHEIVDNQIRMSLYQKLGFNRFDPYKVPFSSFDIAEGTPVKVFSMKKRTFINGTITKQLPDGIEFKSQNNLIDFSENDEILLITHNFTGLYSIKTRIIKVENTALFLSHSENIKRKQHREYFRKKIYMPILICKEGSKEEPDHAEVRDISAGGLSITNPGKKYKKEDDLSLFFQKDTDKSYHLSGEVVRVSGNNKILHIKFGHVSKSDRDRIVGFIQSGVLD
ncbi:MAG: PilZ domain-containing protein [Spirochaetales bacterium]|nr:PilZ domain-containing protein [Spirochaetales bacterium]